MKRNCRRCNNDSSKNNNIIDYANAPYSANLRSETLSNNNFRRALWTGEQLQLTLMSISCNDEIGLEKHDCLEQLLYIESGNGIVKMGKQNQRLTYQRQVSAGDTIIIPTGIWHNLINTGNSPIKLFSVYAPPQHPKGTIHITRADSEAFENLQ